MIGNKPEVFKKPNKLEIVKLCQKNEKIGYEMVKPIYKEEVYNRSFRPDEERKERWRFSGYIKEVNYVAVMIYKGRVSDVEREAVGR